jgi:hypothetical protein
MKFRFFFVLFFIFSLFSSAQNVVLTTCNELQNSSYRNQCLEASLENLLIKEVFRNLDFVKLQPEQPVNLNVGINVSRTGVFAISNISTPNFGLAKSIHNVIKSIIPLGAYKGEKRSSSSSTFEFDLNFILKNNNSIVVLNKANEIVFIKKFKTEREKMLEYEQKEINIDSIAQSKKSKKENDDVAFAVIEEVPIFPGCEGLSTNQERKECMSGFVDAMVRNNFNTDLPATLGMSGRQRISVQFKIDIHGFITDIIAKAPHPALEEEAIRVVNTFPKVIPGKQRGERVNVLYSLPIIFQVESADTKKK